LILETLAENISEDIKRMSRNVNKTSKAINRVADSMDHRGRPERTLPSDVQTVAENMMVTIKNVDGVGDSPQSALSSSAKPWHSP
jgi:hypothetical protein